MATWPTPTRQRAAADAIDAYSFCPSAESGSRRRLGAVRRVPDVVEVRERSQRLALAQGASRLLSSSRSAGRAARFRRTMPAPPRRFDGEVTTGPSRSAPRVGYAWYRAALAPSGTVKQEAEERSRTGLQRLAEEPDHSSDEDEDGMGSSWRRAALPRRRQHMGPEACPARHPAQAPGRTCVAARARIKANTVDSLQEDLAPLPLVHSGVSDLLDATL